MSLFLSPDILFAQQQVTLESFERAVQTQYQGEPIRKLYNARISSGDFTLVTDSAWQFIDKDEIHAFGNIEINTSEETIWADTLFYYTNQDESLLRGRVIILRDSTTLFSQSVNYDFLTKIARFTSRVRLEDKDGKLTANTGTYFQIQDSAVFRGNVQLIDSTQYAEGDSLFINRERGFSRFFNNIFVSDTLEDVIMSGDYLEADSTGRRFIEGDTYLRRIESDSTSSDTTHIFAERIVLIQSDSLSTIHAEDSARVWTNRFSSYSDTLDYNSRDELFILSGNPRAWHKNIQLNGPIIQVKLDSSRIEQLKTYPSAFAVQEDSLTGRFHQLKGDTLIATFDSTSIDTIRVFPNSEVLYHTTDEEGNSDGAIQYTSPYTILSFENGTLIKVIAGRNQGYFLPEYKGLSDRTLRSFSWTPELRPTRPEMVPHPQFGPFPEKVSFILPKKYEEYLQQQAKD